MSASSTCATNQPGFASVIINRNAGGPLSKEPLSNKYSPCRLRALEFIYGTEGIISSGGVQSVDAMLREVDLEGKTLLDVGCGLGGVDIYLARKYKVTITAVDREPFMIECAEGLVKRTSEAFKGSISYRTLANPVSLKEFADNSFDVVMSKQVLYHLTSDHRELYLREMCRVLKPGGALVTEDLLVAKLPFTEGVKKTLCITAATEASGQKDAFCYFITPEEYCSLIGNAELQNIRHIDNTAQQILNTEQDVQRLRDCKESFLKELGADTYESRVRSFDNLLGSLKSYEVVSGIFTATKKK